MKKYNNFDSHMVLLGIIIPFLLFFISLNTTYAYFTATASKSKSSTNTATIKINLSDLNDKVTNTESTIISSSSDSVEVRGVLPGDTLKVNGVLSNSGTASCYTIIELSIDVTKVGATESENTHKSYYTFVVNSLSPLSYTLTEITENEGIYSTNAGIIYTKQSETDTSHQRNFEIPYLFDFNSYTNEYKQATITYTITARAIQTANLANNESEAAKKATELLMQDFAE